MGWASSASAPNRIDGTAGDLGRRDQVVHLEGIDAVLD